MKVHDDGTITLERDLSDLDTFVARFCSLIDPIVKYTLVSGYVVILFGRSRGTEDVDLLIEEVPFDVFAVLHSVILKGGFWALNADDPKELYAMLKDNLAIRFAEKGKAIPNMEVKFVRDKLDIFSLHHRQRVVLEKSKHLWVSSIPLQIAYKRYVLKSLKDLEDAQHLQKVFNISEHTIMESKRLLLQYGKI